MPAEVNARWRAADKYHAMCNMIRARRSRFFGLDRSVTEGIPQYQVVGGYSENIHPGQRSGQHLAWQIPVDDLVTLIKPFGHGLVTGPLPSVMQRTYRPPNSGPLLLVGFCPWQDRGVGND